MTSTRWECGRRLPPNDTWSAQGAAAQSIVFSGVNGNAHGSVVADWLTRKIVGLQVFDDAASKINLALADVGGAVLVISQFTLYGDTGDVKRDK